MNLDQYKSLGVINRTPDSFSDKGQSLNQKHFEDQLSSFLQDKSVICDFGFESTASMNSVVPMDEEVARFRDFLDASRDFDFEGRLVSFDTYRPESFLMMTEMFSALHSEVSFLFNDVSGVLDNKLKQALLSFKGKNFAYIYTFTHIPSRSNVQDHMKFLDESKDIFVSAVEAFTKAHQFFSEIGMQEQLFFDAGFGFSKTYEQNWELINRYGELQKELVSKGLKNPHVIGLSKKSFLKKALGSDDLSLLEGLHKSLIQKMQGEAIVKLLFRVHDPTIL